MRINRFVLAMVLGVALIAARAQDSLDVKIGQMILIGFPGAAVDESVLAEVKSGKVGSLLLFEKNVPKGNASFNALKKIIWTYQKAATIPLFIAIDQEGGKVNRLKEKYGFPKSITAQEMGKSVDSVTFYAESIASNLAGLGINVNFAPCVDLGVNKSNTVIYAPGRAFSANADTVALMAEAYIKPHRRFGVVTVLKHFPGHGSSLADTHFGVADVTKTWSEQELIPYTRLLQRGLVDGIMSAHIVNARLDPDSLPGTLSAKMIDNLLRKGLGYSGVVFSDDMQMQAITNEFGLEEAIRMAITAGVDILCFSNNIQGSQERTVAKVHGIIRTFVSEGMISAERIDQSYRRIMQLKSRLSTSEADYYRTQLVKAEQDAALQRKLAEANVQLAKESEQKAQQQLEQPKKEQTTGKKKKKKS